MNITLLANRDLASNLALNLLLPALADNHRLRLFLSSRVGGTQDVAPELEALAFFEQTLFNDILFPALDGPAGVSHGAELSTFRALGGLLGAEPEILNRINSREGFERVRATEPDLILSIRFGSILKDPVIALPTFGVLNLHSGLLPTYRGVMASFHALMHGETTLGTTLHYIQDAGIDTGDVVGRTRLAVEEGRSYLWHVLALYPDGCRLILETVGKIASGGPVEARPQGGGGAYFSFPTARDLAAFRNAGLRLYDSAEIVDVARRYLPPRDGGPAGEGGC